MDTITHVMFGALAGSAVTNHSRKRNNVCAKYVPMAVTAVAAAFPDSDYFLFPVNPLLFLDEWHRSFTHSFVLLPLWSILLTGIIVLLFPRLRKNIFMIGSYVALGIATHIMLDLLTVYGTKIFYPVSNRSFSLGTTFVIDPYLSLIVLIGLIASSFLPARQTAIICTFVLCAYVLFQLHLKTVARETGEEIIVQTDSTYSRTVALPQPFSPFHWRIIRQQDNHYATALIDLAGISEKLERWQKTVHWIKYVSAYRPPDQVGWETHSLLGDKAEQAMLVRTAWQQEEMAPYRHFAMFPVLYRIDQDEQETCVWFSDLRYHTSTFTPAFRYGMCRTSDSTVWKRYRLRYFSNDRD